MTIRSFAIFGAAFLFVTALFQPTPAQAQIPLSGTVGQFLSQDLGLGAADAVSVGLNAGHLPAGLTLSLAGIQARISGTPTEAGSFSLTVAVNTSGSGQIVQNYSMT
jgi:hypothetical protein